MQRIYSAESIVADSLAALDRLPTGVLLINGSGEVTFANLSAHHMLEDNNGLRLSKLTSNAGLGKLVAEDKSTNKAISNAIRAILTRDPRTPQFSQHVSAPQISGVASYALKFSELGNYNESNKESNASVAIIFIADGRHPVEIDPDALKCAYRLTPTEAQVAILLVACPSLQDAADQLGIGIATVRSHIKQIYAKLGVNTRTSFVKMMMEFAGSAA